MSTDRQRRSPVRTIVKNGKILDYARFAQLYKDNPALIPVLEVLTFNGAGELRRTLAHWTQPRTTQALMDWATAYNTAVSAPDNRWQKELGYSPLTHLCRLHYRGRILAEWMPR